MSRGLSAAIMNPNSNDMRKAYYSYLALTGQDKACTSYMSFVKTLPKLTEEKTVPTDTMDKNNGSTPLQNAVIKGLREMASSLTEEKLKTSEPMSIISEEIIPALDIVGQGFENKTVYLPSLLMSAEAAKSAFEKIKFSMPEKAASDKCTVVIATVKGDIHDIGKNIVKLLLENYGFNTVDLGRDVTPDVIIQAVKNNSAPVLCLSALMTTTVVSMEETIKLARLEVPDCKIVVGGAVLTEEYARMLGADKYAKDAMEAVRYAEKINAFINNL
jgi:5-methyltetrahydrofolate--homocysteine methyltransferase